MTSPVEQGVLTDEQIIDEASEGNLIASDFERKNVRQACYELRAGNVYYDLSDGERRIQLSSTERVLLKPHQMVVVITKEQLSLPSDVLGRILMKGQLFSLGIQPVNTYADPGFSGNLGIVMYNASPNYIELDAELPIAKIEFERLSRPVKKPYSGQHGYQTGIWPVKRDMILSPDQVKSHSRISSPSQELRRAFGGEFGAVVDRVFRYERWLLLSTIAYTSLAVTLIIVSQVTNVQVSLLQAFFLGLITNIVSGVLTFLATSLPRRWVR